MPAAAVLLPETALVALLPARKLHTIIISLQSHTRDLFQKKDKDFFACHHC